MESSEKFQGTFSSYVIGDDTLLLRCVSFLLAQGHEVKGIVSSAAGVIAWAKEKDIPVIAPGEGLRSRLLCPVDWLLSITNLRILPDDVLMVPQRGTINFHDGPLPAYAGLHATTWALLAGEKKHGVTWHLVTSGVDEGEILSQTYFDINPDETAFTLNAKCFEAGYTSFEALVPALAAGTVGKLDSRAQDLSQRSYFGRRHRPPAGGVCSWGESAATLARLVRALDFGPRYPNPLTLAKVHLGTSLYAVVAAEEQGVSPSSPLPGTVRLSTGEDTSVTVATAEGDLRLLQLSSLAGVPISPRAAFLAAGVADGGRLSGLSVLQSSNVTEKLRAAIDHEAFWRERLRSKSVAEFPFLSQEKSWARETGRTDELLSSCLAWETVECSVPSGLPTRLVAPLLLSEGLLSSELEDFEGKTGMGAWGVVATLTAYFLRFCGAETCDFAYCSPGIAERMAGAEEHFASHVFFRATADGKIGSKQALQRFVAAIREAEHRGPYPEDIVGRTPGLQGEDTIFPVAFLVTDNLLAASPVPGADLTVAVDTDGLRTRWLFRESVLSRKSVKGLNDRFLAFATALSDCPERPLRSTPLLSQAECQRVLLEWNDTEREYYRDVCVHDLVSGQAAQTPDLPALIFGAETVTYAELDARAEKLASRLVRLGVGPGSLVGVYLERSIAMIVAVLGVHKAGGAYVPLDPAYPSERIAYMVEDSGAAVLLTHECKHQALLDMLAEKSFLSTLCVLSLDAAESPLTSSPIAASSRSPVSSRDLAYVMYTSGSTGKPKGVMVEHRNLTNFFCAMDEKVPPALPPGEEAASDVVRQVWLAVTSLSFDISVLELFWTLTRGHTVVLYSENAPSASAAPVALKKQQDTRVSVLDPSASLPIDFSLFYFSSSSRVRAKSKYRLLLEGAKFADVQGFSAVWTPERHFHEFGGLYPNPAVTGAAVAALTEHVEVRAGSIVLPLHSPVRVAEEWSVVDNLSNGRVSMAFAAGWQPNDFIFAPDNYADPKGVMFASLEIVQRLWRGEAVEMPGPDGRTVAVTIMPLPLQQELPFWITAAGNPETYRLAGEVGGGLLTHLLGQTLEEVTEKIALYRSAWEKAGHYGMGRVALMLHTFVGEGDEDVKDIVAAPMKEYLRTSTNLVREDAWSFPAFRGMPADARGDELLGLSDEDFSALLDHSFARYYEKSGFFGTVDQCVERAQQCRAAGADEIAALIDFGVDDELVLDHLPFLNEVRARCAQDAGQAATFCADRVVPEEHTEAVLPETASEHTIAALIRAHDVTHLQCTPSQAAMLLADLDGRAALNSLDVLLVGGEAFPLQLARDLRSLPRFSSIGTGRIVNMYGPTETTIWSACHEIGDEEGAIPIGRPIANTSLYILDQYQQPVLVGVAGELWIGGEGVTRGYYRRPDLTSERFFPDPFRNACLSVPHAGTVPEGLMYKTGDRARFRSDGVVEFLGRLDHQVKIRGYRIECGEIETLLQAFPEVRECAVIAREDRPGDVRLVAYIVPEMSSGMLTQEAVKTRLARDLPTYMIPSRVVSMPAFPLTPNKKTDRKALPSPYERERASVGLDGKRRPEQRGTPSGTLTDQIAGIWQNVLDVGEVGVHENFFDLGGHSLLVLQVQSRLQEILQHPVALTDLFRFPTIAGLAAFFSAETGDGLSESSGLLPADIAAGGPSKGLAGRDRAAARRQALSERRKQRRSRHVQRSKTQDDTSAHDG